MHIKMSDYVLLERLEGMEKKKDLHIKGVQWLHAHAV